MANRYPGLVFTKNVIPMTKFYVAHLLCLSASICVFCGCGDKKPEAATLDSGPSRLVLPLPSNNDLTAEAEAEVNRALQAIAEQDIKTTRDIIRRMTPASVNSADLSERLATVCRSIGEVDLAWRFANQAVQLGPNSPSALLVLSVTESDLDWPAKVGDRLKKIKQLAPNSVEPRLAFATFYQAAGQYKQAETEYRELISMDSDNPAGWGMLAANLLLQERFEEARVANNEASKRSGPQDTAVWILEAKVSLEQADRDPANAESLRKRTLIALEEGVRTAPAPAALFVLGKVREDLGDLKGARTAMEAAYKQLPEQTGLRPRLARLRIRLGDRAAGEKLLAEQRRQVEEKDRITRAVNGSGADLSNVERHREVAREADKRKMASRARLEWSIVNHLKPGDPEAEKRLEILQNGVPSVPFPKDFP